MRKNKLARAALIVFILAICANPVYSAGGMRLRSGVLLRSWKERILPPGDSEAERVERFIHENRSLLGLGDNPEISLKLEKTITVASGQRYVYSQHAHGLPVFEAQLILIIAGDKIRSLFNALSPEEFKGIFPALTNETALQLAQDAIGQNEFRREAETALGYSPDGNLIYRLKLPGLDPPADWEVWVDAVSGAILRQMDRRIYMDGSGRIFDPDPKTATNDNTLTDQNDSNAAIPDSAYSLVTLLELNDPVGGYYYLDGPYVSTYLTENRAAEPTPDFLYWREDDRFEEVMVYYHIDREQRYFQNELQTPNANNRQQPCNVNGTPQDQSWYSPFDGSITFGYGGVDDAEDADVILHEYGHAVQDDINPDWTGGHIAAMGEGFSDYLAGAYSLSVNPDFQPNWVFNWDGHNEFWTGRILNANYHYPENAGGEPHDAGQLWSAGLIDVWWDISDVIAWDEIVLQHHFLIGNGALMEDAAEAILVTELALYNGIYRPVIVENFAERGFVDPANYYPAIVHDPLGDSEDTLQTEFEVLAEITSQIPLDTASLQLFWRADEDPYAAVELTSTGQPNEYRGIIPGPFNYQCVSYYLTAADTLAMASFLPEEAPGESFQFYVGPDFVPPEITWTDSLGETVFPSASFPVRTTVTDNVGIGSVELRWKVGSGNWQSAPMNPVAADTFAGTLSYTNQIMSQTVQYNVRATDSSSEQNSADGPVQLFPIAESAQLDDFEGPLGPWIFTGDWGITNQLAYSGLYSLEDSPGEQYPPNSDTWAQWDDAWDLSDFIRAGLSFWEMHLLEEDHDWGRLEVSADDGPWEALFEITGAEDEWYLREVILDDYCGGTCDSLRFRFRTTSDEEGNLFGWYIDDLEIRVEIIVPVEDTAQRHQLPREYALGPVYPNPFNPIVNIEFHLPGDSEVNLKIYNTQGQAVVLLAEGVYQAGSHQVAFDGANLPSGIYFCRLEAGSFTTVEKMVLLK